VRRPDTGVWAQLWSLPEFETAVALERAVQDWPGTLEWLPPFKHVLTHFDWMLQPLRLSWHGGVSEEQQREIATLRAVDGGEPTEGRWAARDDLASLGLPAPIRKLLEDSL